jgi:hypothetical protein
MDWLKLVKQSTSYPRAIGGVGTLWLCFAMFSLSLVAVPCAAQMQDSFEGGAPRWRLVESDCGAQLTLHEISVTFPHNGQTCELMEVAAGNGTMALVAYPIEPCAVLNEFEPRVWARCASSGLRFGVRVIFPLATHPVTGGRLTAILWGSTYSDPGQWQMLKVANIEKLMQIETVALRQRYGADLVLENPFIDAVVMNVYTGSGRSRLQIDDLNLMGLIALPAIGRPIPANWREAWHWRPESLNVEGRFWTAMNRPEVWLQYQGESLPWLKSLGISGLVVGKVPSGEQLRSIQEAKMSVVCPPPQYSLAVETQNASAIRGWLIGSALDAAQAPRAREQATRVAQFPDSLKRPIFGEALEQYWMFSRIADEVIVPVPDIMSAGSAMEQIAWLKSQLVPTLERGHGWVAINTGANSQWIGQYREAQKLVDPQQVQEENAFDIPTDPLAVRSQITRSVASGSKGFMLRSFSPLNLYTLAARAQVASIRWSINDLALWGPWIVAGQSVRPPTLSRSDYMGTAWTLHNSYLIVVQNLPQESSTQSSMVPNGTSSNALVCGMTVAGNPRQVHRLTQGTVQSLETSSTPGGLQWTVPQPQPVETFVIGDNPNVLAFINRHLNRTRISNAEDQLDIAAYQTSVAAELIVARFGNADHPAARAQLSVQERARRQLEEGLQLMRNGAIPAATTAAFQSLALSQSLLDDAQQAARANLAAPQSSPFVLMPAAFKYHWKVAEACDRSRWEDLPLAGSNLTSLDTMLQSGWTQQQRLQDQADMRVEWIPPQDGSGPGLRLAAYQKGETKLAGGYEGASLRVRSAAANVRAGQLVRIKARARVRATSADPASGLLVYDNQAGPGMGQLVRGQPGEQKEIELYRFIVEDGELRVLAECRGQCDIVIESLSTSVIQPATNRRNFPTSPALPTVDETQLRPVLIQTDGPIDIPNLQSILEQK